MKLTQALALTTALAITASAATALPPKVPAERYFYDNTGYSSGTPVADGWCDTKSVPAAGTISFTSPISASTSVVYSVQAVSATNLQVAANPSGTTPPATTTTGDGWGTRLSAGIGSSATQVVSNSIYVANNNAFAATVSTCWKYANPTSAR